MATYTHLAEPSTILAVSIQVQCATRLKQVPTRTRSCSAVHLWMRSSHGALVSALQGKNVTIWWCCSSSECHHFCNFVAISITPSALLSLHKNGRLMFAENQPRYVAQRDMKAGKILPALLCIQFGSPLCIFKLMQQDFLLAQ